MNMVPRIKKYTAEFLSIFLSARLSFCLFIDIIFKNFVCTSICPFVSVDFFLFDNKFAPMDNLALLLYKMMITWYLIYMLMREKI